jgi:hypothetical protein
VKTFLKKWVTKFLLVCAFASCFAVAPCHGNSLLDKDGNPTPPLRDLIDKIGGDRRWSTEEINDFLQEKFFSKECGERWKIEKLIDDERWPELEPIFASLGMINPVKPLADHYHYVVCMGQSVPMMRMQLQFVKNLQTAGLLNFKRIVFLCSNRTLNGQFEGTDPVYLRAEHESAAAKVLLNEYFPRRSTPWTVITVSTSGKSKHINTQDTICQWLKTRPRISSVLMVSNNPFIPYQFETFYGELQRQGWFQRGGSLDFCGNSIVQKYSENNRTSIMLDNVARTLYTEIRNCAHCCEK